MKLTRNLIYIRFTYTQIIHLNLVFINYWSTFLGR